MSRKVRINNKRALLIGINKYPKLSQRFQLNGCVNDVMLMKSILMKKFAFSESNIILLRDKQATRKNILATMDRLVKNTKKNDIVVIHYAGHGSQIRDREGDEPDGWDETIVPHDGGRSPNPNTDITDDEIYWRLVRFSKKTRYVTLIFDCCHSGTITRDILDAPSRSIPNDERSIDELPPSPVPAEIFSGRSRDIGPSGWLPLSDSYVLIAGCRDEETSFELTNGHGALTYYLCRQLNKVKPGDTYHDLFKRVSAAVTTIHSRQHPQIEGAMDREIFGV